MADAFGKFLQGYSAGNQLKTQREQEQRRQSLADLLGQARGATGDQRDALLSQAYGVDPNSAMAAEQQFQQLDEFGAQKLGRMASVFVAMTPEQRAQAWPGMRGELAQIIPGAQYPDAWDESFLPQAQTIAQELGGDSQVPAELQTFGALTSGLSEADRAKALRIKLGLDPRAGLPSVFDTGSGVVGIDRGGYTFRPITQGEVPFTIDPNLPPDVQAAIRDNPDAGSQDGITSLNMGGSQLQSVKPPRAPSELDRRIEMARQMGVDEATIRQMIIGREGAAAGAKPMPAAALRMLTDARAALKEADTVTGTLERIREEIASEALNLGPVRNLINQGRVATGLGNDESTKFSTLMTSLRGLQNASLRLNKGVQTEGDAKRVWQELLGNLNDEKSVLANIDRLIELNREAVELHQGNMELVNENYGRNESAPPAETAGQPNSVLRYNPATGDFE